MACKNLGTIGDVNFVEYGGGPLCEEDDGTFWVEYVEPPEDMDKIGATWTVYRVELEQEIPDWIDMQSVASTIGSSWMKIAKAFKSSDPFERAFAYEAVAANWGWHELDHYPLELGRTDIGRRYDEDLWPLMPVVRERTDFAVQASPQHSIAIGAFLLKKAVSRPVTSTEMDAIHIYEELHNGQPTDNFFVLSFKREDPKAFVRVAYYEPEITGDEPEGVLIEVEPEHVSKVEKHIDTEFPDLHGNRYTTPPTPETPPEEMLRRMSKWIFDIGT